MNEYNYTVKGFERAFEDKFGKRCLLLELTGRNVVVIYDPISTHDAEQSIDCLEWERFVQRCSPVGVRVEPANAYALLCAMTENYDLKRSIEELKRETDDTWFNLLMLACGVVVGWLVHSTL